MSTELIVVELACAHCRKETLHELLYAGRLLVSVRCRGCNTQVQHESNDLWEHYLKDLPHRIATKPLRLWKRFWQGPKTFLWTLPKSTLSKPLKMMQEFRNLRNKD